MSANQVSKSKIQSMPFISLATYATGKPHSEPNIQLNDRYPHHKRRAMHIPRQFRQWGPKIEVVMF